MISRVMKNWNRLHGFFVKQQELIQKSGKKCQNIDSILFSSSTVKIRIEYSHYFASEVLRLRMNDKAGDEIRRNFEAYLFFIRSTLDCLAQMINDICNLGLADDDVTILKVKNELNKHNNLKSLESFLKTAVDNRIGAWFWHLRQLRNTVTHRSVIRIVQFRYIGSQAPKRDDLRFTLEDPRDVKSFQDKPELGLGYYAEDKFNKVYTIVEKTCGILYFLIKSRKIKIVP